MGDSVQSSPGLTEHRSLRAISVASLHNRPEADAPSLRHEMSFLTVLPPWALSSSSFPLAVNLALTNGLGLARESIYLSEYMPSVL